MVNLETFYEKFEISLVSLNVYSIMHVYCDVPNSHNQSERSERNVYESANERVI